VFIINTAMPWNSPCMFRIKVEGYFYDASGPFETTIGGYMYVTNDFYNKGYINIGAKNLPVRFGRNASGNVAIILGADGATYEYPKISVTQYMQTYSSINEATADGWTITRATNTSALTYVTSVPNVTSPLNITNNTTTASGSGISTYTYNGTGTPLFLVVSIKTYGGSNRGGWVDAQWENSSGSVIRAYTTVVGTNVDNGGDGGSGMSDRSLATIPFINGSTVIRLRPGGNNAASTSMTYISIIDK